MAAGDDGPGIVGRVIAASKNLPDGFFRHTLCGAKDIQRQFGFASHSIHIAEGIGSGDFAVKIGIVHDGREEVGGLDQGGVVVEDIDAGVVALVIAHDEPWVRMGLEALQHLRQSASSHLGTAAGARGQLGQFPWQSWLDDLGGIFHPLHDIIHIGHTAHR